MSFPNSASICSRVQTVSSTVSCNSPATMADTSSFKVARTSATASGCFRYGSPDRRTWPSCARAEKSYARRIRRSEEHTSELQSQFHLVCRLLLEKKKKESH